MATASVQDIDSFIRLQKEKLSREKGMNAPYFQQPSLNQNNDYNRQLDSYLNLQRNFDQSDLSSQYPNHLIQEQSSFYQQPQQQYQQQQQQQQGQSTILIDQKRQNSIPSQRITRNYKENDEPEQFFDKFGTYEARKNKLKNDLHQEYNEYLQKNMNNQRGQRSKQPPPVNSEYYATLPLKGMDTAKERAERVRNSEYQILKTMLDTSDKGRHIEWWKDRNEPDIKPYSKHAGSQENLNNRNFNNQFTNDSRSRSTYDVIADRRLQMQNEPTMMMRPTSQNSLENLRQVPMEAWRTPIPPIQPQFQMGGGGGGGMGGGVDPYLTEILRRPPVGFRQPPSAQALQRNQPRYDDYSNQMPPSGPIQNDFNRYSGQVHSAPYYQMNTQQAPQLNYSQQQSHSNDSGGGGGPFNFSEETKDAKAQKAKEYQEELQRQVREKQFQKQREKEEQERLDKKLEYENAMYNPYGRSGGGAPLKDKEGNILADLSQVKADPSKVSPRELPPQSNPSYQRENFMSNSLNGFGGGGGGGGGGQFNRTPSNEMVNFMQMPSQRSQPNAGGNVNGEEKSFARGGNGIFGEGKSDDQKKQEEKYKAELKKQMEEKARQKAEEKEKIRLEEEREMKRIEEQQKRMKAELEEEERKKKAKEENGKKFADDAIARRLAEEKRKQEATNKRKVNRNTNRATAGNTTQNNEQQSESPPPFIQTEFRSNSPPVPAAAKKLNPNDNQNQKPKPPPSVPRQAPPPQKPQTDTTADYYVTESRLNLASPPKKNEEKPASPQLNLNIDKEPPAFTNEFRVKSSKSNKMKNNFDNDNLPPKSNFRKQINREPSAVSNNEVLNQLNNLKRHLYNEKIQVENQLNNANNRTTIGQMSDIHQNILNVKTPTGDNAFDLALNREPARIRREPTDTLKTYRKDLDTPPIHGGYEPRTYFRDNTILLGNQTKYNEDFFPNDLQKQAHERQMNRLNMLNLQTDNYSSNYDVDQLAARNQQRLRKLRDLEGDNLSLADPNEVLNKFLTRNNRRPSATTVNDDTWLRQPE